SDMHRGRAAPWSPPPAEAIGLAGPGATLRSASRNGSSPRHGEAWPVDPPVQSDVPIARSDRGANDVPASRPARTPQGRPPDRDVLPEALVTEGDDRRTDRRRGAEHPVRGRPLGAL